MCSVSRCICGILYFKLNRLDANNINYNLLSFRCLFAQIYTAKTCLLQYTFDVALLFCLRF
jgi:hypothetical protein